MKKILFLLSFCFLALAVYSKDTVSSDKINKMLDDKTFTFAAQSAVPLRGSRIVLSTGYEVKSDDEKGYVKITLPYFGRSTNNVVFPSEDASIKLTSYDFEYNVKEIKHGWEVKIKPNDALFNLELTFTVSESGKTTLLVTDNRRDSIKFYGSLK